MSDLFAAETDTLVDGRPDPGLAYRVAPPVEDAYMPWVTILEPRPAAGELRWEFGLDEVLLPVRHVAVGVGVRSKGRAVRDRLAGLADKSYHPAHLLRRPGARAAARLP